MPEGTNQLPSSKTVRSRTRVAESTQRSTGATPREVAPASSALPLRAQSSMQIAGASASGIAPRPRVPRPPRVPRAAAAQPRIEQPALDFVAPSSALAPAAPSGLDVPDWPIHEPAPTLPRSNKAGSNAALSQGMAGASVVPGWQTGTYLPPQTAVAVDPDVWLIAQATPVGLRPLEGADHTGAIRVSRPYGHLRSLRPVLPPEIQAAPSQAMSGDLTESRPLRGRGSRGLGSGSLAMDSLREETLRTDALRTGRTDALRAGRTSSRLRAARPMPQGISAVEIETDAGVFRVERPNGELGHADLAWALAHLEAGEPDSLVPLPRRQLALLLTLLPEPEDPEHPEDDATWGWAHKLKAPWERGPLHPRGRLGRLIAVDPDPSNRGMHRACFEILGSEEVLWALGVPCYRTGSVYELVPLRRSRWLSWPLAKSRSRASETERPDWEIARVVYRVGAPRWPLAGVVEPLGPLGVAG